MSNFLRFLIVFVFLLLFGCSQDSKTKARFAEANERALIKLTLLAKKYAKNLGPIRGISCTLSSRIEFEYEIDHFMSGNCIVTTPTDDYLRIYCGYQQNCLLQEVMKKNFQ